MPENKPKIGIGVLIIREGKILLGQRKNAHGENTFAPPGGHLEFGETVEECTIREVAEETGLIVEKVELGPFTQDIFTQENKHYITIFTIVVEFEGKPKVMEPGKCAGWDWFSPDDLPDNLFLPLDNLIKSGFTFPN